MTHFYSTSCTFTAMSASQRWVRIAMCGGLMLMLSSCGVMLSEDMRARRDFIQRFRSAHQAHDIDALMRLYCWDGVDDAYRRILRLGLQTEVQYDVLKVAIVELDQGETYDYYHFEGSDFGPNLTPRCKLSVIYDVPERLHSTFMLGKQDGRYWVINPCPG